MSASAASSRAVVRSSCSLVWLLALVICDTVLRSDAVAEARLASASLVAWLLAMTMALAA